LDRILSATPLEDLQIKAPLISEDEPIIIYLDTSDILASPAKEELLQLTAPGIDLENKILHFPCQSKKIASMMTLGTRQRLKGLKFKPAGQDLEEFIASKENLLDLSAIISRNWSNAVEEDDSYILIPKRSTVACKVFRSRWFAMIQEWD
jgi:hypothetical protein